jgi:hypothetical protein
MDFEEEMRLKELYASYPDEMILEMFSQGPGSFRKGVYDVLQSEVKRRRIDPGARQKPAPSDGQGVDEIVFVVIYAGNAQQVQALRGSLEFEGISTFVRDETTWSVDAGGRAGVMKLAVEKKDVEKARRIIEESSQ